MIWFVKGGFGFGFEIIIWDYHWKFKLRILIIKKYCINNFGNKKNDNNDFCNNNRNELNIWSHNASFNDFWKHFWVTPQNNFRTGLLQWTDSPKGIWLLIATIIQASSCFHSLCLSFITSSSSSKAAAMLNTWSHNIFFYPTFFCFPAVLFHS